MRAFLDGGGRGFAGWGGSFGAMKTLPLVILIVGFVVGSAWADQASLDKLVAKEQGNVDNEAVKVYGGTVGKLEAIFFIEFTGEGNRVDGWYYYPSRGRAKRYTLGGTNPKNGVILLQEYTPRENGAERLTANCRLEKRLTKTRIIWEGRMDNTDGRAFKMVFSRKRAGGKAAVKKGGLNEQSTE